MVLKEMNVVVLGKLLYTFSFSFICVFVFRFFDLNYEIETENLILL